MSIPLQNDDHGRQNGGRRLDAYRLRMARIRAEATGESVEEVLAVFRGRGRFGPLPDAAEPQPQPPEAGPSADPSGPASPLPLLPGPSASSGPSGSPEPSGPSGSGPSGSGESEPPSPQAPALAPVIALDSAARSRTAGRRPPSQP